MFDIGYSKFLREISTMFSFSANVVLARDQDDGRRKVAVTS